MLLGWRKSSLSNESTNSDTPSNDVRIPLEKVNGSVADLLQEFDSQWALYLRYSFINHQQSDYIKKIKEVENENGTVVVHIDFSENDTLLNQKEIMQAHRTTLQATIFTIYLKSNKEKQGSISIISD